MGPVEKIAKARLCVSFGNDVLISAGPMTNMTEAPMPWTARMATRSQRLEARALASDASANTARPQVSARP